MGRRKVATGGAQRNPWMHDEIRLPRQGQRKLYFRGKIVTFMYQCPRAKVMPWTFENETLGIDLAARYAGSMNTQSTPVTSSRPRRRWWLVGLICVVVTGCVILCVLDLLGIALDHDWSCAEAETDALEPRWRLAELEADRPPILDADNAALQILRAHSKAPKLCVSTAADYDKIFAALKPTQRMNLQQIDLIRSRLYSAPAAIAEARKLKDMPHGRFAIEFSADYIWTQMPAHDAARSISEWLLHDAYLLAQQNRCAEALGNCRAILNIGRTIGDDRFLGSHLSRMGNHRKFAETAERILAQGSPSKESLLTLQMLVAREIEESNWIGTLKGERAGFHHCFENIRNGKVTQHPVPRKWFAARDNMTLGDWIHEEFPKLVLKYYPAHLRFTNRLIEIAKLPLHQQKAKLQELHDHTDGKARDPLDGASFSFCVRIHAYELRSQAVLRTTLVALACERYRLEHKRWPKTLEVLVAEKLLPALPVDPVDGQPLRYREEAEGIVVYSIGIDENDDQGAIVREPLGKAAWYVAPAIAPAEDIGFRLWNEPSRRMAAPPPPVVEQDP